MSEAPEVKSVLVGTKRVREEEDDGKGRRKVVLTFGPDSRGNDTAVQLANAINELVAEGKQINIDIRIGEQTSDRGKKFPTAFVLVKEMVPKDQGTTKFVPKATKTSNLKSSAEKIRREVEG